jgi:rare lipoprotein A
MTSAAARFAVVSLGLALMLPIDVAVSDPPASARTSSWRTTVVIEAPLPKAPARSVTTGALPPPHGAVATPPPSSGPAPKPGASGPHRLEGIASFYWQEQMTASGERFDRTAMTAAHPTLPFNSRVRVTNVANGKSVVVRINDRGPFKPGRVIDLSYAAAGEIEMRARGLVRVKVEVLEIGPEKPTRAARR